MVKTYLISLLLVMAASIGIDAQVVTSDPTPLQEDSKDVTIFFHADRGTKGLMNQPATAKIYAHTGVCLSNGENWVNAPKWGDNSQKYELSYVSENLWKLYIGDIREYYNVSDPSVQVTRLAFVFRNSNGSKEGKDTGGADIFIDVLDSGLQLNLGASVAGSLITDATKTVKFTVDATREADLSLKINGKEVGAAKGVRQLVADYTFSDHGNYEVTAVAKTGDAETSVSKNFCYAPDSKQVAYPGGNPVMGPVKNADGSVTFCLGAPEKSNVILIGEWNGYEITESSVMNYTDADGMRYFWTTVSGLDNSKRYGYYFLVDGTISVGDPYARLVLDPWNDKYILTDVFPGLPEFPFDKVPSDVPLAIYQGNINDYDWQVTDFKGADKSNLVIYELLLRDFTGTEGKADGNGTVRDAMAKLPYLKSLGVNAIELLPINEFNGNNSWGYNPNFYFAPDKAYGTPDDYKEFIDLCHQNGMAVILDVVFNQSDGLHPWYKMYEAGKNPFYNQTAPHAYNVLNDWNQGFPMVQKQWHDMLRYWLTEYNVDGFRFDLVKGLGDNDSYSSSSESATNAYNQSRIDRMIELKKTVDEVKPGAYFINEDLATAKEENAMAEHGEMNWANLNNAGCQFAMGYSSESNLNRAYAPKDDNRLWGSTVSYLESHDEQRLAYKQKMWGVTGVKGNHKVSMQRLGSAFAQLVMAPGAHMIWQFSELGNDQNSKNTDGGNNTDPKIVNWGLLDNDDNKGLYQNYCELIAVRTGNPEMFEEG